MILDRIDKLLAHCGETCRAREGYPLHTVLNFIDSAVGADTEWLSSLECSCLWHVGKMCERRRAIGARVRMLEEIVALSEVKKVYSI